MSNPWRIFLFAVPLLVLTSSLANAADGFALSGNLFVGVYDALRLTWEKQISGCVWSDAGETLYTVTADGLNDTASTFRLENDVGDPVDYDVFWNDVAASAGREELLPGVGSSSSYPVDPDVDCDNIANAYLTVLVDKTGLDSAPAGIYTDLLTLTVDPL